MLEEKPGNLTDALTLSRVSVYPIDILGGHQIDLENIAEATGGKVYYYMNGFKQVVGAIVSNGSSFYTLAYSTTNQTWNGQFRRIKVTVDRPGLQVQYRHGYYAVDRAKQEKRLLAAMAERKAKAASNPFGDDESQAPDATPPASTPVPVSTPSDTGALINHPKGGFEATMQLGAIPPTEIIFAVQLAVDDQKVDKNALLPANNYLEANF